MTAVVIKAPDGVEVSDGYHTFGELYDHRITLWIALCSLIRDRGTGERPWRSQIHSDGSVIEGWFLLGRGTEPGEQITYHLPISRWSETDFADTRARAPEFDGHTSADVLARIKEIIG